MTPNTTISNSVVGYAYAVATKVGKRFDDELLSVANEAITHAVADFTGQVTDWPRFKPFLAKYVRNAVVNYLKSAHYRRHAAMRPLYEVADQHRPERESVLSPYEFEVMDRRYNHLESLDAIASAMDVSCSEVRQVLIRGCRVLRGEYGTGTETNCVSSASISRRRHRANNRNGTQMSAVA